MNTKNKILLVILISTTAFINKKIYSQLRKEDIIEYIVSNRSDELLAKINAQDEDVMLISKLNECTNKNCLLNRLTNKNYRVQFEKQIINLFSSKTLPTIIKDNSINFTYTSFGSGYEFQDLVILVKIMSLIRKKYNTIKTTITINFIDYFLIYHKEEMHNQIKKILCNEHTSVDIIFYNLSTEYINQCKINPQKKSHIIVTSDLDELNQKTFGVERVKAVVKEGFVNLIINALQTNGFFVALDKFAYLRPKNIVQKVIQQNNINTKDEKIANINLNDYFNFLDLLKNTHAYQQNNPIGQSFAGLFHGKIKQIDGIFNKITLNLIDDRELTIEETKRATFEIPLIVTNLY